MTQLIKEVFGEDTTPKSYRMEPHNMSGRVNNKPYCVKCGLVSLNNGFSRWSIDKGCLSDLHPSFKTQRKKAGVNFGERK
jgi:hypothetical protein